MNVDELVRLKLEMEFGVPVVGDTLPTPRKHDDGHPRFIVSRHAGGYARFYHHALPAATRDALAAIDPARALDDAPMVEAILARHAPVRNHWRVYWYTVAAAPPADDYPDVVIRDGEHVVLAGTLVVARAWTTQDSSRAVEVEVETHPDYRRRGYGRQVVASWAAAALAGGKVAFYSHNAANAASEALVRSLGLAPLSLEVEYQ